MTNPDARSDKQPAMTGTPTGIPAVSAAVASGTTEAAVQIEGLLAGIETVEDPNDQQILLAAWRFLQSPGEKNLADLTVHAAHVGSVIEGYAMTGGDAPDVVNTVYARLELLQRQHHIAAAWGEFEQPAPDLLHLLYHIRMASSNATSMPAAVGEEIDRLRAEIAARGLQSNTYDRMCELSALVAETLPHLADGKNVMTAKTTAPALTSGDTVYIAVALELAPKLRADAGKKGEESQVELRVLADKIDTLAGQLQAAAH